MAFVMTDTVDAPHRNELPLDLVDAPTPCFGD